jgi:UDP-N-acetylmuramoylalanine--D-glutamate ligase
MKNIIILGAGESGTGAAILAKQRGLNVFVSDKSAIGKKYILELNAHQIDFEQGTHDEARILAADTIVKSPGIPTTIALIQKAKAKGIEIISEIEFGFRFIAPNAFVIGITGSNGKTTTTKLTHHLLKIGGKNAVIGGNYGYSFARLVAEDSPDFYVLELSSFQLDDVVHFRPNISILLNISPDHLDRYEYKMENYVASKFQIVKNQLPQDTFIFNEDNLEMKNFLQYKQFKAKYLPIATRFEGQILRGVFDLSKTNLRGPHNFFNASCAIEVARRVGVSDTNIQEGLNTFVNEAHRLEFSGALPNGVQFINDSKATNVDAVFWALQAVEKSIILVLGGLDKGNDYTQIADLVRDKVIHIIAIGIDNEKIKAFFADLPITEAETMQTAVQIAARLAPENATVLLSPACASFDRFKNYEDRGNQFKVAVKNLLLA